MTSSAAAFRTLLGILILFVMIQAAHASTYQTMKQGVEAYNQKRYDESLSRFQEARVESPDDPGAQFNLASAQYQTGKFDEAARGFEAVLSQTNDPLLKQKAFYNLGNTAYRQGNLQAAADYYRKALDLRPSDLEARQNLEFILTEQEKKQKNQNKDDRKPNDDEKNKDQQKSGQQNKQHDRSQDQKSSEQKQQSSRSQQGEQKKDAGGSAPSPQDGKQQEKGEIKEAGSGKQQADSAKAGRAMQPGAIAPEEAERLLNTLSDDQRAFLREQARRLAPGNRGTTKDW